MRLSWTFIVQLLNSSTVSNYEASSKVIGSIRFSFPKQWARIFLKFFESYFLNLFLVWPKGFQWKPRHSEIESQIRLYQSQCPFFRALWSGLPVKNLHQTLSLGSLVILLTSSLTSRFGSRRLMVEMADLWANRIRPHCVSAEPSFDWQTNLQLDSSLICRICIADAVN